MRHEVMEIPFPKAEERKEQLSEEQETNTPAVKALSFFSGAGGLDIGSHQAGVEVMVALDFDLDSTKTMQQNNLFKNTEVLHKPIQEFTSEVYQPILDNNSWDKLIMLGGPPCQPFSKAGYWVGHDNRLGMDDPRNMVGEYLRVIDEIRPDGFVLENVESMMHPKNKPVVDLIEQRIVNMGYHYRIIRANALDYGVPQKRKRVFFVASKSPFKTEEPLKTHGSPEAIETNPHLLPYETVGKWIKKFNKERYFEPEETTEGKTYDAELKEIPPGKNYFALTERDGHPNPRFEANKRFWSFLLKLHPDQPSWTIAAQPGPWVGPFHWDSRRLRAPEIAAIQTFPEKYKFYGTRRSVQKQIGNAVPPVMGKAIVAFLKENL